MILKSANGEAQRLFHGRGKKVPAWEHVCIDHYPPLILITAYREVTSAQIDLLLENLNEFPSILLQKRYLKNSAIEILKGELPAENFAVENSEKYLLNLAQDQNIGFFLDMAVGREWLRKNADGKKVLNLFAYTCSLSVAALKGGVTSVVNMDMSRRALTVGEKNHALNGINRSQVQFLPHDIMKSFGPLVRKGPFDIVIIDPPTNQGDSFKVDRDYHKIIRRLAEFTSPGCIVMACLNSPFLGSDFLKSAFLEHAPDFKFVDLMYSSFADMEVNPEEGLKILFFQKLE